MSFTNRVIPFTNRGQSIFWGKLTKRTKYKDKLKIGEGEKRHWIQRQVKIMLSGKFEKVEKDMKQRTGKTWHLGSSNCCFYSSTHACNAQFKICTYTVLWNLWTLLKVFSWNCSLCAELSQKKLGRWIPAKLLITETIEVWDEGIFSCSHWLCFMQSGSKW